VSVEAETGPRKRLSLSRTFTAFKYPNYRLWFFGQLVSLFGTWMQSTAQGFLIYELTHSVAYLGYVTFASGLANWVFTLYAGAVADRMPRRTLLLITQSSMMTLAFILGALTLLHVVQPWHILVLAFCLGVANAFDAPARLAFVLEMVDREDLVNAVALNSSMFNLATVTGPAAAGLAYARFGPGWCFVLNGASFIAIITGLSLMKLRPWTPPARRNSPWADIRDGVHYVLHHPSIRAMIVLIGAINLFGNSFGTILPAWAVKVLGGDATTNGLLQSARGVGALTAALFIASSGRLRYRGRLLMSGVFVFPVALAAFALMRWLPLSLLTLVIAGGSVMLANNLLNSLVQSLAADELRGRVMSIWSLTFMGLMSAGGLWIGTVAQRIGEPPTILIGAGLTFFAAVLTWVFVPRLRHIQ
jgi:MFS family permease